MKILEEFKNATIVLVAICLVTYAIQFFFGRTCTWADIKEWTLTNSLFSYPFYFANKFLVDGLDKHLAWRGSPKRAAMAVIISMLVNLIVIYIVITLVTVFVHGGSVDYVFTDNGKNNVLITFVIVTVICLIFYVVGFYKEAQEERLLNETLRKEKITAELSALKAQLDPHFLFNSFNVLSGLIDEDPPQAQKFLGGLSKIYRYVLENRNEDLVSLEAELGFAKDYLDLQKIRFEESIHLDLVISADILEKKLPALSLQLVLENAVKHNGFDLENPLKISIVDKENILVVSNNKKPRTRLGESSGIGLANITERYALHNISGFRVEENNDFFIVYLPLISSQ